MTNEEIIETTIARLSREAHGGQQISFIESENAADMIAVHADSSAATVLFGTAVGHPQPGVDLIFQSDGTEHYAFISREAWDTACIHLIETALHPEWSYARQMAFGSQNVTNHKPCGLIVSQESGLRGLRGWRITLAQMMNRPIYTALEMTDGSTCWERWS